MNQQTWYLDSQWWAIIAALSLGLSGIFQDKIRSIFFRPKLEVSINLAPPDCQKMDLMSLDKKHFIAPSYYLRFKIENTGNYKLEDVEAMIIGLEQKNSTGCYEKKNDFLPINLLWSHCHSVTIEKIQPRAFKHLDFGPIANGGGGKTCFRFDLFVQPNNRSGYLHPGEYIVEMMFLANNHKPIIKKYAFIFGPWSDDEIKMLGENVVFKEV